MYDKIHLRIRLVTKRNKIKFLLLGKILDPGLTTATLCLPAIAPTFQDLHKRGMTISAKKGRKVLRRKKKSTLGNAAKGIGQNKD